MDIGYARMDTGGWVLVNVVHVHKPGSWKIGTDQFTCCEVCE